MQVVWHALCGASTPTVAWSPHVLPRLTVFKAAGRAWWSACSRSSAATTASERARSPCARRCRRRSRCGPRRAAAAARRPRRRRRGAWRPCCARSVRAPPRPQQTRRTSITTRLRRCGCCRAIAGCAHISFIWQKPALGGHRSGGGQAQCPGLLGALPIALVAAACVQGSCIYWLGNAADPGQHRQLKVRLPVNVGSEPHERPLCAPQHYFGGGAARPLKGGVQAAAGVTRLMHQCTAMLRERMCDELRTPPAAPPVRCAHPQATGAERIPWTTSEAAPAGSPPLGGLAQRATGRTMPADGKGAGAPSALGRAQVPGRAERVAGQRAGGDGPRAGERAGQPDAGAPPPGHSASTWPPRGARAPGAARCRRAGVWQPDVRPVCKAGCAARSPDTGCMLPRSRERTDIPLLAARRARPARSGAPRHCAVGATGRCLCGRRARPRWLRARGAAGPQGRRARAQEYEKRLLAKDQEVKGAQAALRRLEAELHDERAAAAQAAAAAAHMLPAPEPKQGAGPLARSVASSAPHALRTTQGLSTHPRTACPGRMTERYGRPVQSVLQCRKSAVASTGPCTCARADGVRLHPPAAA